MRSIPLLSALLFVLILMIGSIVEHFWGRDVALHSVYHSPLFFLVWGILVIGMCIALFRIYRRKKSLPSLLLHFAIVLISIGAALSHTTSRTGSFSIARGEVGRTIAVQGSSQPFELPFTVALDTCFVEYYPATDTPKGYVAKLILTSPDDLPQLHTISMNNIVRSHNYRLYLGSLDPDYHRISLMVNYDPYGIAVTYTGYLFFLLGWILLLVKKDGRFIRLLRSTAVTPSSTTRAALLFFYLIAPALNATASNPGSQISDKAWKEFNRENVVLYNGRIVPLTTLAREFTSTVYGKPTKRPDAFLWDWILHFEECKSRPLLYVKSRTLRDYLGVNDAHIPLVSLFDRTKGYRLQPLLKKYDRMERDELTKAAVELNGTVQWLMDIRSGTFPQVFPCATLEGKRVVWLSLNPSIWPDTQGLSPKDLAFYNDFIPLIQTAADATTLQQLSGALHEVAEINAPILAESRSRFTAENIYQGFPHVKLLFMFTLTVGFLVLWLVQRRRSPYTLLRTLLALLPFLYLTFIIALRWYILGHMPVVSGYETMLSVSWFTLLLSLILLRRAPFFSAVALLSAGFCLLVASIGMKSQGLHALMPVLHSPLLSLHVSVIMLAYALFMVMTVTAIAGVSASARAELCCKWIELLAYPALFLLSLGIILGAVWANISWGNYWSWDPKEVWALITLITYAMLLHRRFVPVLARSNKAYLIFTISIFSILLMTYFGVNYLLGGLHAYA